MPRLPPAFGANEEYVRRITADWQTHTQNNNSNALMDVDYLLMIAEPHWNIFFRDPKGNAHPVSVVDKIRLQSKLITRANATPAGMLSIENFIEWYRVTCDLWESMRENLKEGKKPPPNFQLVWDDSMLTAKVTFDTYDDGDEGLITAESLLEVARPVFSSFSSGGEPISLVEQIKLSDELLNYQQPGNCGLMSFMDYAAWHSRIPQILAGIRSLRNKQRTVHGATSNGTSNGSYTSFLPNEKIVKNPVPVKARAQSPQLPGHHMQPMTQRADSSQWDLQREMFNHSSFPANGHTNTYQQPYSPKQGQMQNSPRMIPQGPFPKQQIRLPEPTAGDFSPPKPRSVSPQGPFYQAVLTPFGIQMQLMNPPQQSPQKDSQPTARHPGSPVRPPTTPGHLRTPVRSRSQNSAEQNPAARNPVRQRATIGLTLGRTNNSDFGGPVYILAIHPNGPAGRHFVPNGILEPMQELVSVDGWSVNGKSMVEISQHCSGDVGSTVTLEVRTVPAKGNYSFQIEIQREPVGFDLGTFAPPQQMQQNQMRVDAGYHQQPIQPQQAHRQSMQPQQAHRQSMQPQQPHRESMQPQQQQQQQQPGMLQGRPIPQHAGMRVRDKTPVPQGTPARAVLGGTPVRSHTPIRFDGHVQRGQHPSPAVHTIVGYTPQGVPITAANPQSPRFGSFGTVQTSPQGGESTPPNQVNMPWNQASQNPRLFSNPQTQHAVQSPRMMMQPPPMAQSPRMMQQSPRAQSPRMMIQPQSPRMMMQQGMQMGMPQSPRAQSPRMTMQPQSPRMMMAPGMQMGMQQLASGFTPQPFASSHPW